MKYYKIIIIRNLTGFHALFPSKCIFDIFGFGHSVISRMFDINYNVDNMV